MDKFQYIKNLVVNNEVKNSNKLFRSCMLINKGVA